MAKSSAAATVAIPSAAAAAAGAQPKRTAQPRGTAGGVGAPDLDRVIHERMRLGIISALAANPSLTFNDLKKLLDTTDGNLSVHARKLEDAGYIRCSKTFEGRMPRTDYSITEEGRKALTKYIDHMEALIEAMKGNQSQMPPR